MLCGSLLQNVWRHGGKVINGWEEMDFRRGGMDFSVTVDNCTLSIHRQLDY